MPSLTKICQNYRYLLHLSCSVLGEQFRKLCTLTVKICGLKAGKLTNIMSAFEDHWLLRNPRVTLNVVLLFWDLHSLFQLEDLYRKKSKSFCIRTLRVKGLQNGSSRLAVKCYRFNCVYNALYLCNCMWVCDCPSVCLSQECWLPQAGGKVQGVSTDVCDEAWPDWKPLCVHLVLE